MGKRKYLWGGFLGAVALGPSQWLFKELLGWQFGKLLDAAERGEGPLYALFSWGLEMLIPNQDIFTGISIGIGFSLLVTYWPLLRFKARRSAKWAALFLGAAWRSRPGHRLLTWGGGAKLLPGVQHKIFDTVPFDISTAEIRNQSNPSAVYLEVIASGKIRAIRLNKESEDVLITRYQLWGRPLFWASIRRAWKMDSVGLREWVIEKQEQLNAGREQQV